MSKKSIIAAIELGSSKIATIISQLQVDPVTFKKEVSVIGVCSVASKGIKKGQIVNIEEAVDATIESVEGAERMAGYNLDHTYVALGGAHLSSQNSHGVVAVSNPDSEITEGDVERVIEAASAVSLPSSREIVHVIPREFIVDGESGVRDPVGMSGIRLEVQTHLVTASSSSLKNLTKALDEVGVKIDGFVFSGLASAESVLTKTEKELGCVLVDIGGGTTSIAAYIDGSLAYSSEIPIGANNVTNDLAIGLRVSLETAEKIKVTLSDHAKKSAKAKVKPSDELDLKTLGIKEKRSVSQKTLTEGIIRPRINEIFTMVRLHLEKDNLLVRVPSGVIVTGGGAQTVGILDSAKRMMSLPVRIGKPKGVVGLIDDVIDPSFSTCVGAILYASLDDDASKSLGGIASKVRLPGKGTLLTRLVKIARELLP